jgi:CheY-like chemotaxis protein
MIRILIVGNKVSALTLIDSVLLQIPGVTVIAALTNPEAVEILNYDKNFDVIMIDSNVPDIEIHKTFLEIRQLKIDIPTIIMSAALLKVDFQSFFKGGLTEYLALPYTQESVLLKLQQVAGFTLEEIAKYA